MIGSAIEELCKEWQKFQIKTIDLSHDAIMADYKKNEYAAKVDYDKGAE